MEVAKEALRRFPLDYTINVNGHRTPRQQMLHVRIQSFTSASRGIDSDAKPVKLRRPPRAEMV